MEIIAEIGQNYNGDLGLAFELIKKAKSSGAHVAKFQLFDAKALFTKENNPWYDYNLKNSLSRDDIKQLARACDSEGIEFMASVFDTERVAWLEEVGMKRYKIASRSINDKPLVEKTLTTGKPVLASLGMWNKKEFPDYQGNIEYFYCISKYPTPRSELCLGKVDFSRYVGLSDHSEGIAAALTANLKGAKVLEKHFTLDKGMYGPDHSCSMTPDELKLLTTLCKEMKESL